MLGRNIENIDVVNNFLSEVSGFKLYVFYFTFKYFN